MEVGELGRLGGGLLLREEEGNKEEEGPWLSLSLSLFLDLSSLHVLSECLSAPG